MGANLNPKKERRRWERALYAAVTACVTDMGPPLKAARSLKYQFQSTPSRGVYIVKQEVIRKLDDHRAFECVRPRMKGTFIEAFYKWIHFKAEATAQKRGRVWEWDSKSHEVYTTSSDRYKVPVYLLEAEAIEEPVYNAQYKRATDRGRRLKSTYKDLYYEQVINRIEDVFETTPSLLSVEITAAEKLLETYPVSVTYDMSKERGMILKVHPDYTRMPFNRVLIPRKKGLMELVGSRGWTAGLGRYEVKLDNPARILPLFTNMYEFPVECKRVDPGGSVSAVAMDGVFVTSGAVPYLSRCVLVSAEFTPVEGEPAVTFRLVDQTVQKAMKRIRDSSVGVRIQNGLFERIRVDIEAGLRVLERARSGTPVQGLNRRDLVNLSAAIARELEGVSQESVSTVLNLGERKLG